MSQNIHRVNFLISKHISLLMRSGKASLGRKKEYVWICWFVFFGLLQHCSFCPSYCYTHAVEFTLCRHSLPQILLQSALRVLQLKLLSTIKEYI